jgi:hypothetical protein
VQLGIAGSIGILGIVIAVLGAATDTFIMAAPSAFHIARQSGRSGSRKHCAVILAGAAGAAA